MIKKYKVMIDGVLYKVRTITFASEDNLYVYVDSDDPEIEEYEHSVSQSDLKQFINYIDKYGNEIYEDDVVEIHSNIPKGFTVGKVVFKEEVRAFMVHDLCFDTFIPITEDCDMYITK